MNLRGCHYPLDHYLYDESGALIWTATTWTWWQKPYVPPFAEMLCDSIETRNALGLVVNRTDLRPVIAA